MPGGAWGVRSLGNSYTLKPPGAGGQSAGIQHPDAVTWDNAGGQELHDTGTVRGGLGSRPSPVHTPSITPWRELYKGRGLGVEHFLPLNLRPDLQVGKSCTRR